MIVSQLFGARRHRELKTAVSTTLIAGGVLCLALMAGGMLLCSSLLHLIHTPENVMADSRLYLDIYILGLPFVFYYNIATGVFSALGDSKTPFIFLAISSTANIAVDILFVTAFNMGVAGVAWATFLCQGVSCVLAMTVMLRRLGKIHPHEKAPLFSWDLLGRIALIAIPSTLQQSFISVGNIMIQGVINSFGSSVMAGYSASVKLNNLVISSMTTLGNGISNYTAQNLGAGKNQRVRDGFRAGLEAGVGDLHPHRRALLLRRANHDVHIHRSAQRRSYDGRHRISEDPRPLLLHRRHEAGLRWDPAGRRDDEAVHGRHLHRSGAAGGTGLCVLSGNGHGQHRDLAGMAGGLVRRLCSVPAVLPPEHLYASGSCRRKMTKTSPHFPAERFFIGPLLTYAINEPIIKAVNGICQNKR